MRLIRIIALTAALGCMASLPQASYAQIVAGVSITLEPPALPVYVPPPPPAPAYIWAPGYWAWGLFGYYWVPGTWVQPPAVGLLWTPGYWGWRDGIYVWNGGYWGRHVGFYGGVHYGFGYDGEGFHGGGWDHGQFVVNRNVYNNTTIVNNYSHTSFNGGPNGIHAQPNAQEQMAMHEHHVPATQEQVQHRTMAANNPALRASANHGRPPIAATPRPGVFSGHGVVAAHAAGAPEHPQAAAHAQPAGRLSPQVDRNMRNAPSQTHAEHPQAMAQHQAAHPPQAHGQPAPAGQGHPSPYAVHHAKAQAYHPPAAAHPQQHAAPAQHEEAHPHGKEER